MTEVGAPAAAASSAVGTGTAAAQYGHFTRFPADSSRARNRLPQDGQPSVMGMACPPRLTGQWSTGRVRSLIGPNDRLTCVGHGKRENRAEEPPAAENRASSKSDASYDQNRGFGRFQFGS